MRSEQALAGTYPVDRHDAKALDRTTVSQARIKRTIWRECALDRAYSMKSSWLFSLLSWFD